MALRQTHHFDADRLPFPLASLRQPGGQALSKAFGRKVKSGLQAAVGNGKCVIELRGVREVAHAELVKPLERAGFALATNQYIHLKFLRVHEEIIAPQSSAKIGPFLPLSNTCLSVEIHLTLLTG